MDGDETAEKCIKNDFLVSFVRCCCHDPSQTLCFLSGSLQMRTICTPACTSVFIKNKGNGETMNSEKYMFSRRHISFNSCSIAILFSSIFTIQGNDTKTLGSVLNTYHLFAFYNLLVLTLDNELV